MLDDLRVRGDRQQLYWHRITARLSGRFGERRAPTDARSHDSDGSPMPRATPSPRSILDFDDGAAGGSIPRRPTGSATRFSTRSSPTASRGA